MNMYKISFRRFTESDIEKKIEWINDPLVNKYLHYDLPLQYDSTLAWFKRVKDSDTRADYVVEIDGIAAGLIGLLGIDYEKKEAEYYFTIGEADFRGKGISGDIIIRFMKLMMDEFGLETIWMSTEKENIACKRVHERIGFRLIPESSERYNMLSDSVDAYEISSKEVNI